MEFNTKYSNHDKGWHGRKATYTIAWQYPFTSSADGCEKKPTAE